MKSPLPLLAVCSLLFGSACAPKVPNTDDGQHGYTSPEPATNGDMSDTGDYGQRNRENMSDTLNPTPPPPVRPDSTNRMPPE
jgi:hypothetical protein